MDVLLYSWTGPESPIAKATVLSVDPDTLVGGEPLGPATYEMKPYKPAASGSSRR